VTWLHSIREKLYKMKPPHLDGENPEVRGQLLNRLEQRQERELQIQEMIRKLRKIKDDYKARNLKGMPMIEPVPGDDLEIFRAALRRIEYEEYGA
jgi:hypothetical protein